MTTRGRVASVLHRCEDIEPAHIGQPHVEQHDVERLASQRVERSAPVRRLHDEMACLLKQRANRVPKPAIVVDDQHATLRDRSRRHDEPPGRRDGMADVDRQTEP